MKSEETYLVSDFETVKQFVFAGNAYFTIKSLKTGNHFSYRVSKNRTNHNSFFVSVKSGYEYTYLGIANQNNFKLVLTKASPAATSPSIAAFEYFLRQLLNQKIFDTLEFFHMGACGRCARPLTDPESIRRGIGPICETV